MSFLLSWVSSCFIDFDDFGSLITSSLSGVLISLITSSTALDNEFSLLKLKINI
jgi:hypothetical protein